MHDVGSILRATYADRIFSSKLTILLGAIALDQDEFLQLNGQTASHQIRRCSAAATTAWRTRLSGERSRHSVAELSQFSAHLSKIASRSTAIGVDRQLSSKPRFELACSSS
jgi:hypothetical protein